MLTKTTLNDILKPKINEEKSSTKLEKKTTKLKDKSKDLLKRKELYKERQIKRENLKKEIQKVFEQIPDILLIKEKNTIQIKNKKYRITYKIEVL